MSWLSEVGTYSNPTLGKDINQFGQDAGVEGGICNADATAASKFYTDILGGDPTKQAQAIAPQTAAAQEGAQQQKNQASQFAPRSGGMTATMSGLDENTRAQLIKLLGSLTTSSASGAAGLGSSLLTSGMSGQAAGFGEAQAVDPWEKLLQLGQAAGKAAAAGAGA